MTILDNQQYTNAVAAWQLDRITRLTSLDRFISQFPMPNVRPQGSYSLDLRYFGFWRWHVCDRDMSVVMRGSIDSPMLTRLLWLNDSVRLAGFESFY